MTSVVRRASASSAARQAASSLRLNKSKESHNRWPRLSNQDKCSEVLERALAVSTVDQGNDLLSMFETAFSTLKFKDKIAHDEVKDGQFTLKELQWSIGVINIVKERVRLIDQSEKLMSRYNAAIMAVVYNYHRTHPSDQLVLSDVKPAACYANNFREYDIIGMAASGIASKLEELRLLKEEVMDEPVYSVEAAKIFYGIGQSMLGLVTNPAQMIGVSWTEARAFYRQQSIRNDGRFFDIVPLIIYLFSRHGSTLKNTHDRWFSMAKLESRFYLDTPLFFWSYISDKDIQLIRHVFVEIAICMRDIQESVRQILEPVKSIDAVRHMKQVVKKTVEMSLDSTYDETDFNETIYHSMFSILYDEMAPEKHHTQAAFYQAAMVFFDTRFKPHQPEVVVSPQQEIVERIVQVENQDEINRLMAITAERDLRIADLEREIEEHKENLARRQEIIQSYEDRAAPSPDREVELMRTNNRALVVERDSLIAERSSLVAQMRTNQQQYEDAVQQLTQAKMRSEGEILILRSDLTRINAAYEQLNADFLRVQSELKKLKEENAKYQLTTKEIERDLNTQRERHQNDFREMAALREQLEESARRIQDLQLEIQLTKDGGIVVVDQETAALMMGEQPQPQPQQQQQQQQEENPFAGFGMDENAPLTEKEVVLTTGDSQETVTDSSFLSPSPDRGSSSRQQGSPITPGTFVSESMNKVGDELPDPLMFRARSLQQSLSEPGSPSRVGSPSKVNIVSPKGGSAVIAPEMADIYARALRSKTEVSKDQAADDNNMPYIIDMFGEPLINTNEGETIFHQHMAGTIKQFILQNFNATFIGGTGPTSLKKPEKENMKSLVDQSFFDIVKPDILQDKRQKQRISDLNSIFFYIYSHVVLKTSNVSRTTSKDIFPSSQLMRTRIAELTANDYLLDIQPIVTALLAYNGGTLQYKRPSRLATFELIDPIKFLTTVPKDIKELPFQDQWLVSLRRSVATSTSKTNKAILFWLTTNAKANDSYYRIIVDPEGGGGSSAINDFLGVAGASPYALRDRSKIVPPSKLSPS